MKKFLAVAVCAAMLGLSGCGAADDEKLSIVCVNFSEYDWVRQIMGGELDNADVTFLLENGSDAHSYQPTAEDILKISDCDLLIYTGGESDRWIEEAAKNSGRTSENGSDSTSKSRIRILDVVETMEEEHKEGMQEESDEHEHDGAAELDEHVWLSVKCAEKICDEIAEELGRIDGGNKEVYEQNLADYKQQLESLDSDFNALVQNADNRTLIFADRFPFRYFVEDYGLDYYAAFAGCAADSEASFETITFLAEKLDETGCDTVYTIENSDGKIAKSVIENSKTGSQKTVVLNSLQSVTRSDIDEGATYLSLMRKNYEILKADIGQ